MGISKFSNVMAGGFLFFSSALVAALMVYFWWRPSRKELVATGLGAAGLAVWLGVPGEWYAKVMLIGVYWTMTAFAANFILAWTSDPRSKQRIKLIEGMVLIPGLTLGTLPMLAAVTWLTPQTLDYYLYAGSLGFGWKVPPDFLTTQLVMTQDWLRVACEVAYLNLPVGMTVMFLMVREKSKTDGDRMFKCCLWLALVGWICFFIFPATGTVITFGPRYPYEAPALADMVKVQLPSGASPRNCIPSLHTSWVMALYWFSRPLSRWVRAATAVFCTLTLIYVLVCGHYVWDIIGSLPWVTAIYAWSLRDQVPDSMWRRALVTGGVMYFAILAYLRFGVDFYMASPVPHWVVTGVAVGWTGWAIVGLHRAVRAGVQPLASGLVALGSAVAGERESATAAPALEG